VRRNGTIAAGDQGVAPGKVTRDELCHGARDSTLDGDEPPDLYEIIRARYEHGSMIIASNRTIEEWYPLFLDDLMASAAMDRLLHHAHVVTMDGHSFRNRRAPRSASSISPVRHGRDVVPQNALEALPHGGPA